MQTVFIAGATGYLGRYLCAEFGRRGWHVRALVREARRARDVPAHDLIEAQATAPATLRGLMEGADLVVSALGITRQADGLGYWDVDYQANVNLLEEAQRAGVPRFAYVHVLNADRMARVPLVAAKAAFVRKLQLAPLASTVIAPSGYFSDMGDFLDMARKGRVWLFGAGNRRINPIHGADLAAAGYEAIARGEAWGDIGGPEIFTHRELAELAFRGLGQTPRMTHLPDVLRRGALGLLPHLAPRRIAGPAQFFLSALGEDMIGAPHGVRRLERHFEELIQEERG
ncbi:MAG: SDR family oxidoreductase [Silicimonas sp.]|nr:SDR family oxidoreductase [Silicimonas sp.]